MSKKRHRKRIRFRDVVFVGGPLCGKTMSITPPWSSTLYLRSNAGWTDERTHVYEESCPGSGRMVHVAILAGSHDAGGVEQDEADDLARVD